MKHKTSLLMAMLVVLISAIVAGCGGSDSKTSTDAGNSTDRAFVAEMIPHHQSAIEMAKIAQERGKSTFVKQLAANIVKTQSTEITTLKTQDAKLAKDGIKKGDLGMGHSMMGMDMDTESLKTASPFDPAFLKMMVPHHEGAVQMAKVELAKGKDPALKQLAQQIIDGQQKEIEMMRGQLS